MVHRLGVRDAREGHGGHLSKPLAEVILGDVLLEKRRGPRRSAPARASGSASSTLPAAVHVVVEIREELTRAPPSKTRRGGETCSSSPAQKRGAKRVHVAHRARVNLRVELPGDGQVRGAYRRNPARSPPRRPHRAERLRKAAAGGSRAFRLRLAREELGDDGVNLLLRRVASLLRLLQRLDDGALFRGGRLGLGDVLLGRLRRRGAEGRRRR